MRRILAPALCAVFFAGCITMRTVPINASTPNLAVAPESRVPLRVAFVVPDPMGMRVMWTPPGMAAGGAVTKDQTEEFKGEDGLPVGRELSRTGGDVCSQVFEQCVALRQLPPPGAYDAVVIGRAATMNMTGHVAGFTASMDYNLDWKLEVLDKDNAPIMSQTGRTPTVTNQPAALDPAAKFGEAASELISGLVKEWGSTLSSSDILRNYARQIKK